MCVVFGTVPPTLLLFTYIIYKEEKPRRHVRDFFILKLKSRRLAAANEEQIKGKPVHIHFRSLCLAVVCVHIPLRISQRRSMLVLINRSFEFKKREDFVCWTIATRIISFYLIKFEGEGGTSLLSCPLFCLRGEIDGCVAMATSYRTLRRAAQKTKGILVFALKLVWQSSFHVRLRFVSNFPVWIERRNEDDACRLVMSSFKCLAFSRGTRPIANPNLILIFELSWLTFQPF